MSTTPQAPRSRRFGLGAMVAVAVAAFGFSFALVPMYRIACEKVFGIRLEQGPGDARAAAQAGKGGRSDRLVTVTFDAGVNSKLPWEFSPNQRSMRVRPGELYETTYHARNTSKRAIVGSATPSVAPALGSKYFIKTECFCFTAQTLAAGESREMPVRFMIDRDLPDDLNSLTLSYTFFKNDLLTARLSEAKPGGSADAPRSAP
jgi:cytochrome c oxidase assembly protein subunit 11